MIFDVSVHAVTSSRAHCFIEAMRKRLAVFLSVTRNRTIDEYTSGAVFFKLSRETMIYNQTIITLLSFVFLYKCSERCIGIQQRSRIQLKR